VSYTHTNTHTHTHTHFPTHTHALLHTHKHTLLYTHTHALLHTHTHIHSLSYTHTHTHTHKTTDLQENTKEWSDPGLRARVYFTVQQSAGLQGKPPKFTSLAPPTDSIWSHASNTLTTPGGAARGAGAGTADKRGGSRGQRMGEAGQQNAWPGAE